MRPHSKRVRSFLAPCLAMTLALPPSPAVGTAQQDPVKATTETAFGLHTVTFDTLQGTVTVNLPDDTAPGDSISGTVIAEPKGKTEDEQAKNQDELNGYVVEVDRQQTPTDQTSVRWVIPAATALIPVILRTRDGREIGRTQVPVAQPGPPPRTGQQPTPGPGRQPRPSPGPNQPGPPPGQQPPGGGFQLPSVGQAGKPTEIKGSFDGDFGTTSVAIGGEAIRVLAESPRKAIVQSPTNVVGNAEIQLVEQGRQVKCRYRAVAVRLSAPKTALTRGEQTTMTVTVTGLDGLRSSLPLRLQNRSPGVVRMDGGNSQTLAIGPRDVRGGGTYATTRSLTGVGHGGFVVTAAVGPGAGPHTTCQPQGEPSAANAPGPNTTPGAGQPPGLLPPTQRPREPAQPPPHSNRISAASGGRVSIPGASLTIPPRALSGDATVRLIDQGPPTHHPEDPLRPASSCYAAEAEPADGASSVRLRSPGVLEIEPSLRSQQGIYDVIVAEPDPEHEAVVFLHHAKGAKDGEGKGLSKLSYDYHELGSRLCLVAVPALPEKPVEKSVLQVPWYWQGGLPWCAPTSLTEMIRYYDFSEDVDPLNAAFGPSTALANWQVAAKNGQPADAGAGYGQLDNIGVKGHWEAKAWDLDFLLTGAKPEGKTDFSDLVNYLNVVNTGYFGLGTRKPIAIAVDFKWHSYVVVGVDHTGVYRHDSNGGIAKRLDWLDFVVQMKGMKTDAPAPGAPPPEPRYAHTLVTAIVHGYPIKPEAKRQGSIVIGPEFVDYGARKGAARLAWDGAPPHHEGYYFEDDLGEERAALRTLPVRYQYRIANVTNVPLTFKTAAGLSGPTYGAAAVSRVHTVTVEPYSLSKTIMGQFDQPATATTAYFTVKLFEVVDRNALQDVKFVRYTIEDPPVPTVTIASPVDGAKLDTGSSTDLAATSFDPSTRESGGIATSSTSIPVELEPSDTTASVTILEPEDGAVFDTGRYDRVTAAVTLLAAGSPGMTFTWTDSIQGSLGDGATLAVDLLTMKTGNCAASTEHALTLRGIDAKGRTASQSVRVFVHTRCLK